MAPEQLRGSLFIHPDLHRGSLFHGDVLTFFWYLMMKAQHKLSRRPKGDQLGFHPGRSHYCHHSWNVSVNDQGFSFNLPILLYIAFRELSVSKSAVTMSPAVICGVVHWSALPPSAGVGELTGVFSACMNNMLANPNVLIRGLKWFLLVFWVSLERSFLHAREHKRAPVTVLDVLQKANRNF